MANLLAELTKAVLDPPKEVVEEPVKSSLAKPKHGLNMVRPRPSKTSSLWTKTQFPGPGSYNLGKYSSFEQRDPRATFVALKKLKEARERQIKVTRH